MLDIILKDAARELKITEKEIDAWREATKEQTEADYIGNIRQRQADNPMRSSTPIGQQITNSQQHLWNLIEKAEPLIKKALPLLLAISIKRMRIEALEEARLLHRDQRLEDRSAELHRDYTDFCMDLDGFGASSSKVRQVKKEEKAILADLVRWKAGDPLFEMADNPWPTILAMYAGRIMEREVRGQRFGQRSIRGITPPERKEPWATKYWRFGDDSQTQLAEITTGAIKADEEAGKAEDQAPIDRSDAAASPDVASSTIYDVAKELVASLSAPQGVASAPPVSVAPVACAEATSVTPSLATAPTPAVPSMSRPIANAPQHRASFADLMQPGTVRRREDDNQRDNRS